MSNPSPLARVQRIGAYSSCLRKMSANADALYVALASDHATDSAREIGEMLEAVERARAGLDFAIEACERLANSMKR